MEIWQLTATELRQQISKGEISAREATESHLSRMNQVNGKLNAVIESCETEREVIIKWCNFINQLDPDIILGYNIFGFDYDYIYKRAIELGCSNDLCYMGKLQEPIKECDLDEKDCCKTHWINKSLSSSALGDNFLKFINMEGRVSIDLMKEIQKSHNLDTYKLDFVSQHFINGKINTINKINDKTKLIWIETPTNPMMNIIDVISIVEIAKISGIKVAVDNTFATPYLQRPLELGADIVMHSVTKYLGGHSDVVMGALVMWMIALAV